MYQSGVEHLIEKIFSKLNETDILHSAFCVSSQWREIFTNTQHPLLIKLIKNIFKTNATFKARIKFFSERLEKKDECLFFKVCQFEERLRGENNPRKVSRAEAESLKETRERYETDLSHEKELVKIRYEMSYWSRTPLEEISAPTNQNESNPANVFLLSFFLLFYNKLEHFQLFVFLRLIGKCIFNKKLQISSEKIDSNWTKFPMFLTSKKISKMKDKHRIQLREGKRTLWEKFHIPEKVQSPYFEQDTRPMFCCQGNRGYCHYCVQWAKCPTKEYYCECVNDRNPYFDCYPLPFQESNIPVLDENNLDIRQNFDRTKFPFFVASEGLCEKCNECNILSQTEVLTNVEIESKMKSVYGFCKQRAFDFCQPIFDTHLRSFDSKIPHPTKNIDIPIRDAVLNPNLIEQNQDPIIHGILSRPEIKNFQQKIECKMFCKEPCENSCLQSLRKEELVLYEFFSLATHEARNDLVTRFQKNFGYPWILHGTSQHFPKYKNHETSFRYFDELNFVKCIYDKFVFDFRPLCRYKRIAKGVFENGEWPFYDVNYPDEIEILLKRGWLGWNGQEIRPLTLNFPNWYKYKNMKKFCEPNKFCQGYIAPKRYFCTADLEFKQTITMDKLQKTKPEYRFDCKTSCDINTHRDKMLSLTFSYLNNSDVEPCFNSYC